MSAPLVAGLAGTIAVPVVFGIVGSRRAIRAPRPQVALVVDDGWD